MKLRKWQSACVKQVLQKYNNYLKHFMCLATPAAGKTTMAAEVALQLVKQDKIDFVICFCPTKEVEQGIRRTFERHLSRSFNGSIGALGGVYTYQSLLTLTPEFWQILREYRVLVIFDELHHCAGDRLPNANAWGAQILINICDYATYTLGLSGTPWRSDRLPITLGRYLDDNQIECDFTYGLKEAVADAVCRQPRIVLIDNDRITVTSRKEGAKTFGSLTDAFSGSDLAYKSIISEQETMKHILSQGVSKLSELREQNPDAGGLVVASSIEHAIELAQMLQSEFGQSTVMVSHQDSMPSEIIDSYRKQTTEWIVSVGMVSEGTDIPRLQVCCYLSHVRTEMYYRQVLGRILRVNSSVNQEAWFYTFSEANLVKYANRIQNDLPDTSVIYELENEAASYSHGGQTGQSQPNGISELSLRFDGRTNTNLNNNVNSNELYKAPDYQLIGQYRQKVISLFKV
ncbi:DEAD/DEAH box helicase [Photobacterium profundum]|uniref:Helicase ATP-binding domain-containing protein n=1 Tax=Photobacterium profundum (strain SS9) TaxID=298386 RepID=Q6LR66_PHOPR|nr:DEAD/DEAH box helicase family protein [Photobacterium profundum]CAG20210.1 conserved hypothetical protein [Photobacterium profundum SS9]